MQDGTQISAQPFIVDPQKLKACLISITQNDSNHKEAELYLNECEKYPNYLITLLELFESLPMVSFYII